MRIHYLKLHNMTHLLPMNVLLLQMGIQSCIVSVLILFDCVYSCLHYMLSDKINMLKLKGSYRSILFTKHLVLSSL